MGLAESVFGTPGTQNWIKSGGSQASPGYQFARSFYDFLPSLMQQAYPTYQGSLDPGLSPTLQDAIRRAQGYSQSSPAEILQGVQGTLGSFMNKSFLNPWNAMMGGNPNYGGADPMQRIYGGQSAGSYGGFAGGNPGMGTPPGVPPLGGGYGGGQGFAAGEPAPGGGGFGPTQPRSGVPPLGGGGMGTAQPMGQMSSGLQTPGSVARDPRTSSTGGFVPPSMPQGGMPPRSKVPGAPTDPSAFQSALGMNFNDAQGALARQFQGNPNGLNSALANQYGMNQFGQQNDGRQQFMHSTDHQSALQRILGREPTFDEVQQSLRSGPGAIEQARGLFMQDYNGSGDWNQGQKDYASLVNQYGLARGSQMFEQQVGNGPMWAGGSQPGQASPGIPPLGGSSGGASPSGPIIDPAQLPGRPTTGSVGMPLPGGAISSSPSTPITGRPAGQGGVASSPLPPLGSVPQVTPRPATPGRPGSTDQVPKGGKPGQVFNSKTGNWHTPGAGQRRQAARATKPPNKNWDYGPL